MRILHVSDLHYALPQLDWVVGKAASYDLVVMSGDQLDISSAVPLPAQIAVVHEYLRLLHDAGVIVVSSGNHDLTGPDANGEQAALWFDEVRAAGIPTDGESLLVDETLITICPWWDGPIGREAVATQLAADAGRRPARWIWVYHWPPVDSPTSWTGRRHYGDADLAGWIAEHQPDIVLAGHVHQPPFEPEGGWADRIGNTWVFNPGKQRGRVPTRIELDLDAGEALWVSIMGDESCDLTAEAASPRTVF